MVMAVGVSPLGVVVISDEDVSGKHGPTVDTGRMARAGPDQETHVKLAWQHEHQHGAGYQSAR